MVFSASSVTAFAFLGSSLAIVSKQAMWVVIGLPLMLFASRLPVRAWRLAGYVGMATSLALLVLVAVAGTEVNGNRNWLDFGGPFRIQPSELAKLSLILWGADLLARKERLLHQWKHLLVPLVPVGGGVLGLVLLGGDLGTAVILAAILGALLWVAGAPARLFALAVAPAGLLVALDGQRALLPDAAHHRLAAPRPGRPARRRAAGAARQVRARLRRLVGRRARRVEGEVGRACPRRTPTSSSRSSARSSAWSAPSPCSTLIGALGYAGLRVALAATDPFVRLAAAGVTAWLLVQALVNIGAVLGLLPIMGVPLPLVSYGGSALVPTMLGIGMLLSFARRDRQEAARALDAERPGRRPGAADPPRGGAVAVHVVVAGGGSAGHIEPALAFADALRRRDPSAQVTALGTERGLDTRLIPARGYPLRLIPPVPIPRRDPVGLLQGARPGCGPRWRRPRRCCARSQADALVGFGGFVAGPAYLAARRARVPIVVHEANPRPGWANRLGARLTTYVATSFPGTPIRHGRLVGLPIRQAVATLDRAARRGEGRAAYGLDPDRPTLLVTGGSQGARRLNEAAAGAAGAPAQQGRPGAARDRARRRPCEVPDASTSPPYVVVPYLDRMELAYAAADLALCRAGANTVVELTAVGLPAAYVPLPIGNGEQELIARPVVEAGGGLLVDDASCTPDWVRATLTPLLTDPGRLATMSAAAASSGRRDADERLVDLVLEAIAARGGREAS